MERVNRTLQDRLVKELTRVGISALELANAYLEETYLPRFNQRFGRPVGKAAALDEAKRWLRELSTAEALKLFAELTNGVVRGTRGKDEDLKLVLPAADPKDPDAKAARPFADPRYWAAFILIGDPN